jgi:SAM-dependent methyltransferase
VADRPHTFSNHLRRIRYSIASTGLRRGLSDLAVQLLGYRPDRDRSFDNRYGTDTGGSVGTSDLGIADDTVREQAILYLPSPERVTRWMLSTLRLDYRTYSFVDLGCGKGRVLLVASTYPFQRVIGVEISQELSRIARENVTRFPASARKADVEVQTIDAATIRFPATNLLIHMYHPFGPELTRVVLRRLEESVREQPRQVTIAYLLYDSAIESVDEVFAAFPWLKRQRYERSVLGHYNWLFYANEPGSV